jgi:hypothetical protein
MLALAPVLLLEEPVLAATFYVSKSTANGWSMGSDTNACTATNAPCLSIAGGIDKMSGGDTLLINDGTYNESLNDVVPSGRGTEATRTVIKCFKPRACTLDASFWAWNFLDSDTNWITIQDMVVCCGTSALVRLSTSSGPPYDSNKFPHHMRFQNNEIHTTPIYAIYTGHGSDNEWLNNYIHDCGEQCAYVTQVGGIWRANEFYRVLNGFQFITMQLSGGVGAENVTIEGNYFHDCVDGSVSKNVGIEIADTFGHIIRRNVFAGCNIAGIRANAGSVTNAQIDHNVFYGNGNGILISNSYSSGNVIRNNIAVGNIGKQIALCSGCGTEMTNLTTGVPTDIWMNPASRNFTLKPGSVAIDRGTPIGLPFYGSAPDLGAYESGGSADTTPPLRPVIIAVQ